MKRPPMSLVAATLTVLLAIAIPSAFLGLTCLPAPIPGLPPAQPLSPGLQKLALAACIAGAEPNTPFVLRALANNATDMLSSRCRNLAPQSAVNDHPQCLSNHIVWFKENHPDARYYQAQLFAEAVCAPIPKEDPS